MGGPRFVGWPSTPGELDAVQAALAAAEPDLWTPGYGDKVGGCFVCFEKGTAGSGAAGDRGWSAAAIIAARAGGVRIESSPVSGHAGAGYQPGRLALREGPLLAAAVERLRGTPDVLLVNGTGQDHPRWAGLAVHLGAVLSIPTVGVTHRPLVASGAWPAESAGAKTPLVLDGEVVAVWLRVVARARPLVVHPGWRTDLDAAVGVVTRSVRQARTPEPLREARRVARLARARATGATR